MREPAAQEMLARVRGLPAGRPLMAALEGEPGVYLVGGAVRDLLLGGAPSDLDVVVEREPSALAHRIGEDVVVHDRFGTSTASAGGFSYDVARARRETYSRPGALPDVAPATIDEDLRRRDFTINAVALALGGARAGELTAFPGALDDLEQRRLRVLHGDSFSEDPTRLLRLARYHGRLGFEVEPGTRELVEQALRTDALTTVSGPRIGNELRLLAREADPVAGFRALRELGLDRAIAPRFGLDDEPLARTALALLPDDARPDLLTLALASRGLDAQELRGLLDRLGFASGDRDVIVDAATKSEALAARLAGSNLPSAIAEATSGARPELVALAGALGAEAQAREWLERLRRVELEIDGDDLLKAGVPQGPGLGRALRAALAAKLDGRARGRDQELAAALEASRVSD